MRMEEVLAAPDTAWSLEDLVETANGLLPSVVADGGKGRDWDDVSPRAVQYYATQGLIDRPVRAGRQVRYGPRHLLQLLVVRSLASRGYTTRALLDIVQQDQAALLGALTAGTPVVSPSLTAAQRELLRIRQEREASAGTPAPEPDRTPLMAGTPGAVPHQEPSRWTRLEVQPGLELAIRQDWIPPTTSLARQQLTKDLQDAVMRLERHRKRRSAP